ncbi:hypothetical protein [Aureimonas sp. AU12]|uniref:hypothetical protein n=1 Tax=Aureimonas sp. AU12 TaxID=1638161 RepID=UPI00078137ED|nr:hypothetical protein [Aureimonas sp. AU12]
MIRYLLIATTLTATLTALISAPAATAAGLIPGSDTGTRQAQTVEDFAVGSGRFGDTAQDPSRTYGYPATDRAAPRATSSKAPADAATTGIVRGSERDAPTPAPARGRLVPGSDSF